MIDKEESSTYLSIRDAVNIAKKLEQVALGIVSTIVTKLDKIYDTHSLNDVKYEADRIKEKVEIVVAITSRLNKYLLFLRDKLAQEIDYLFIIQITDNILDLFYWIKMNFHTMDDIERRIRQGLSHTYNEFELIEEVEEEIRETEDLEKAKILSEILEILKSTLSADKALMQVIHMSIRASVELAMRKIDSVIQNNIKVKKY
ncbi:hypothetical protein F0310_05010 (plasmid) [Borrelia sp. A-FGy1]|uniref:hypothetical protein n=1 Tax=Borrelia sp. A-FGy1 TaxID=2608247 RepID=UPI0015F6E1EA|nr:hypothetical protein [Borrelia sp. A-FGy1]QMU99777.1 hypothetical protein F0310_05010 [Borrelia sp. A-FGy1]